MKCKNQRARRYLQASGADCKLPAGFVKEELLKGKRERSGAAGSRRASGRTGDDKESQSPV